MRCACTGPAHCRRRGRAAAAGRAAVPRPHSARMRRACYGCDAARRPRPVARTQCLAARAARFLPCYDSCGAPGRTPSEIPALAIVKGRQRGTVRDCLTSQGRGRGSRRPKPSFGPDGPPAGRLAAAPHAPPRRADAHRRLAASQEGKRGGRKEGGGERREGRREEGREKGRGEGGGESATKGKGKERKEEWEEGGKKGRGGEREVIQRHQEPEKKLMPRHILLRTTCLMLEATPVGLP